MLLLFLFFCASGGDGGERGWFVVFSFHLWLVSNLLRLLLARVICFLLCNVAAVLCAAAAAAGGGGGVGGEVSLLCTPFICGLSAIFFACYWLG